MRHLSGHPTTRGAFLLAASIAFLAVTTTHAIASIPDANIEQGVNRGGMGFFSGAWGHADFALDGKSAIGAYVGVDPNDVYFNDYSDASGSDAVAGGHYMYQFVEGSKNDSNISVAGIFGAFANRDGVRPELGVAMSAPIDARWTARVNAVYGPSWGAEVGYKFNQNVEGTIGITGMGMLGLGFTF